MVRLVAALLLVAGAAAPADAIIGGDARGSAALARQLGAARVTMTVVDGLVVSEEWELPVSGWPHAEAEAAIRQVTGVRGPFASRQTRNGRLWLTSPRGDVAVLDDAPIAQDFSVTRAGGVPAGQVWVYTPAEGLKKAR